MQIPKLWYNTGFCVQKDAKDVKAANSNNNNTLKKNLLSICAKGNLNKTIEIFN